ADAATRAKTRASIAIAADIRPVSAAQPPATIHVNQLVRVQAHGTTVGGETGGGNINGDIIADGAGTLFGGGDNAIGQVRAWNAIRGKVEAVDKDIFAVRIVGDPDPQSPNLPPEG